MYTLDDSALTLQAQGLIDGERNRIANLANLSALLMHSFESLNWAGFYLAESDQLVLGPFQGQPACIRIDYNRGVCGAAATSQETQRVDDVHAFADHIACDAATNSELVVPILVAGKTVAVIDLDSTKKANFDTNDEAQVEALAELISQNWDAWY